MVYDLCEYICNKGVFSKKKSSKFQTSKKYESHRDYNPATAYAIFSKVKNLNASYFECIPDTL